MPSRRYQLATLQNILSSQITNEVQVITDFSMAYNIGTKRNNLLSLATGKYVVFIDDDDIISNDYIEKILKACKKNTDCIGISGVMVVDGLKKINWHISKEYKTWHDEGGVYYRTTNHISPVKRELALMVGFPETTFGEDFDFSMRLLPLLKTAIVSFANNAGNYKRGMDRLSDSLCGRFDGDFLGFIGEEGIGAPLHSENPYAFKIYAIERAIEAGYEQIFWADTSCYAIAPVEPVFDKIKKDGYIIQEIGHYVGTWTNDFTLNYFNITRDEAMTMKCYSNGGIFGLDFKNPIAAEFFRQWKEAMLAGCFKGYWTNDNNTESDDDRCKGHRHDLSCGGIIANKLGMVGVPGNEWFQYAGPDDALNNDTIIFKLQGL